MYTRGLLKTLMANCEARDAEGDCTHADQCDRPPYDSRDPGYRTPDAPACSALLAARPPRG